MLWVFFHHLNMYDKKVDGVIVSLGNLICYKCLEVEVDRKILNTIMHLLLCDGNNTADITTCFFACTFIICIINMIYYHTEILASFSREKNNSQDMKL